MTADPVLAEVEIIPDRMCAKCGLNPLDIGVYCAACRDPAFSTTAVHKLCCRCHQEPRANTVHCLACISIVAKELEFKRREQAHREKRQRELEKMRLYNQTWYEAHLARHGGGA